MNAFFHRLACLSALLIVFTQDLAWAGSDQATQAAAEVTSDVADFYAQISAQNLVGVQRYVPVAGFSEVGIGESEPHQLGIQAFDQLFRTGLSIHLRTAGVKTQIFGDTAIVTGNRIGSISAPDKQPAEMTNPFTMVWIRDKGHWLLHHVHLSSVTRQ